MLVASGRGAMAFATAHAVPRPSAAGQGLRGRSWRQGAHAPSRGTRSGSSTTTGATTPWPTRWRLVDGARLYRDRPNVAMLRTAFERSGTITNAVTAFDIADNGMGSMATQS